MGTEEPEASDMPEYYANYPAYAPFAMAAKAAWGLFARFPS